MLQIEPLLLEVETLFQLLSNFAYNNEATQNEISNGALSVVVHKLWPWCVIKPSLQITTLKMLCTVTHNSNEGNNLIRNNFFFFFTGFSL